MSKIGRSGGQIESCVADVWDPDALSVGRKRSHSISSDDTVMDHSGLEESSSKRSRVCVKDGVMQCLRPGGIDGGCSPLGRMAQELSRCLHEVHIHALDHNIVVMHLIYHGNTTCILQIVVNHSK